MQGIVFTQNARRTFELLDTFFVFWRYFHTREVQLISTSDIATLKQLRCWAQLALKPWDLGTNTWFYDFCFNLGLLCIIIHIFRMIWASICVGWLNLLITIVGWLRKHTSVLSWVSIWRGFRFFWRRWRRLLLWMCLRCTFARSEFRTLD